MNVSCYETQKQYMDIENSIAIMKFQYHFHNTEVIIYTKLQ
jgi:hypothetical protein